MREEIVSYLENNAVDDEGFPLLEFLPEFTSWEEYLQYMSRCNTFGDQITLFAAANLYNVNIQVISTLEPGAQHLFEPSSSSPLATVYLGHLAQGEHYVSIMPWVCDTQNKGPECEGGSGYGRDGDDGSRYCSLRGMRLKRKGKGVLGAREKRGAREEGGRETPARRPLFFSFLTSTRRMLKS